MSRDTTPATRRRVLRLSGATLAGLTATGAASADHYHPEVTTDGASSIGENDATLEGTLTDMGNDDQVEVWFDWGKAGTTLPNDTNHQWLDYTTSFAHDISGLERDTTYEFRASAWGNDTLVHGDVLSFTTDTMLE